MIPHWTTSINKSSWPHLGLQALLHNLLLRNYFLRDKYNRRWCKNKEEDCACCELDRLFTATHTSPPQPAFGPTAFLATTWRAVGSLACYADRNAHECLITLLYAAHAGARGSTLLKYNCIVHSTFGGLLQSDMRFPRCNSLSETVDPQHFSWPRSWTEYPRWMSEVVCSSQFYICRIIGSILTCENVDLRSLKAIR